MNIIIIEDEIKTAKSLESLITAAKPGAKVIAKLQSIESAVAYFTNNDMPDLAFMDVQLSDGLCFEIFKSVKITCPIIFCTAFDEYSLEAFKSNGIDYVLKPFSQEDITGALKKADELKNFFQQNTAPDINSLLSALTPAQGKKNFLVFKNQKYLNIPTDTIAFFYIKYDATFIMCFDQQEYNISQSLDQVAAQLPELQFFRLNRQYLISFDAIKEVEHFFQRKLYVKLTIPTPEKLLIHKDKVSVFLRWMENR
ncbi:LytR/AlgR family response regulator transcription factor [Deminuibacter soli]|uniref:DNA-binding response regulator n=1 Tax=Deminuibacter soli TaxID=2291815 RepID=A0A3E1NIP1_9BACT|nr:LytTR family DNA-binding domain-containing protein [Deminuibacter soli]RFM27803.1 DNA-binding response regulator [Deminuibacter soli]